jgi:small subunit ribosomal protein S6e
MAQFKLVLSDPKTGKSQVHELKDSSAQPLVGKKIGEAVDGTLMGLSGMMVITGGSDRAGFPMRGDVQGGGKKYVLLTRGVGLKTGVEGSKRRKLVRGNTISEEIYQVNARVTADAPRSA